MKRFKVFAISIPFLSSNPDTTDFTETEAVLREELRRFEAMAPISGWERVKYMLQRDNDGNFSSYVANTTQVTFMSGLGGFVYGGFKKANNAYMDFMRTNQATKFLTATEAKKSLQDRFTLALIKGGYQLSWRTALFGFMFMATTNITTVYRNKDGILEYSLGGASAGCISRVSLGLRGMIVGSLVGGFLGTVGGTAIYTLLVLAGISMSDMRESQYMYHINRQRAVQHAIYKSLREDALKDNPLALQKIEEDERKGRFYDSLDSVGEKKSN